MAIFRMNRLRSWTILVAAIVIAAASWGAYAWRHARDSGQSESTPPLASAADDGAQKDTLVSLRATRPARPAASGAREDEFAVDDLDHDHGGLDVVSRAVTANTPPVFTEPLEMTLSRDDTTGAAPSDGITAPPALQVVQAARSALARGDLVEARGLLSAALAGGLSPSDAVHARGELVRIADALLFSRATNTPDPLTDVYEVSSGDTLYAIARQFKVTEELLASINGLDDPNRLHVGQRLKIIRGPFHAIISKSQHRMDVYLGDALVRAYRVGLGSDGSTPTGTWAVNTKLKNPDWTDPITNQHYLADDPDNPIGERWIGLEGLSGQAVGKVGFGIHGTIEPESIGENMSLGCIRLLEDDVNKVFDLLVDRHSRVEIVP